MFQIIMLIGSQEHVCLYVLGLQRLTTTQTTPQGVAFKLALTRLQVMKLSETKLLEFACLFVLEINLLITLQVTVFLYALLLQIYSVRCKVRLVCMTAIEL